MHLRAAVVGLAICASNNLSAQSQASAKDSITNELRFPAFVRATDSLEALDPAEGVTRALKAGDTRLLGIQGYSLNVPGVRTEDYHRYRKSLGFRAMDHPSDSVLGPDHMRYIEAAHRYAREYNRILLCRKRLRSN